MYKQKEFLGTKSGYINQNVQCVIPGTAQKVSLNKLLTDLVGETLVYFLTEDCGGLDAKYDHENSWTWINGIPYMFYVQSAPLYTQYFAIVLYIPFNTAANALYTAGFPSTTTGTVYGNAAFYYNTATGDYKIAFRFIGDANTAFVLLLPAYIRRYRASAGNTWAYTGLTKPEFTTSARAAVMFLKGKDLYRDLEARFVGVPDGSGAFVHEIGENGDYLDVGFSTAQVSFLSIALGTRDKEAMDIPNRLLLIKVRILFFELHDCYMYPAALGLPNSAGLYSDAMVFIEIAGEKYWIANSSGNRGIGIVRCPTPDCA